MLKWDITEIVSSTSVNFIDINLSIKNGRIVSKTYQKDMNLHLYIPTASDPSSCTKGTIFSLILRYFKQNTYQEDFTHFIGLLYLRTLQRGWDKGHIRKLILDATRRVENPKPKALPSEDKKILKDTLFLHFQFHKDGISRLQIREEFENTLGSICKEELGTTRTIVAFSRPKNIGDFVTQAKL